MSEIKVDKISPQSGTALAVGDSGDTITIPSGATITNSGTATGFGGGKVIQVVNTIKTDVFTSSATSPTDITGMELAITPSTSGNKLLILAGIQGSNNGLNWGGPIFNLEIDGTIVGQGDAGGSSRPRASTSCMGSSTSDAIASNFIQHLYTTTSTSEHVIKIQAHVAGGTMGINRTRSDTSDSVWYPRTSSHITIMELDYS